MQKRKEHSKWYVGPLGLTFDSSYNSSIFVVNSGQDNDFIMNTSGFATEFNNFYIFILKKRAETFLTLCHTQDSNLQYSSPWGEWPPLMVTYWMTHRITYGQRVALLYINIFFFFFFLLVQLHYG